MKILWYITQPLLFKLEKQNRNHATKPFFFFFLKLKSYQYTNTQAPCVWWQEVQPFLLWFLTLRQKDQNLYSDLPATSQSSRKSIVLDSRGQDLTIISINPSAVTLMCQVFMFWGGFWIKNSLNYNIQLKKSLLKGLCCISFILSLRLFSGNSCYEKEIKDETKCKK